MASASTAAQLAGDDDGHGAAQVSPSLYSVSTELCADSIESHPTLAGVFALGTYQVDKQEADDADAGQAASTEAQDQGSSSSSSPAYTRKGTVTLYRADVSAPPETAAKQQLACQQLHRIDTPAVLDMRWLPRARGEHWLATAHATGTLQLLKLDEQRKQLLHAARALTINPRRVLCLSLDWAERQNAEAAADVSDSSLIISQSDGSLAFLPSLAAALDAGGVEESKSAEGLATKKAAGAEDEDDDQEEEEGAERHRQLNDPAEWHACQARRPRGLETWHAHDNEAWIAAWDPFSSGTVLWSGADDLTLKGWDVRTPLISHGRAPTFTTRRPFATAGVTCLAPHPCAQHLWAVGSYDERVRLFDARSPARPLGGGGEAGEIGVGGGVWRLRWHPSRTDRLLVGAMHGGFKVLHVPAAGGWGTEEAAHGHGAMRVVRRFDEHESIAYGCDWERGSSSRGDESLVYSCSFYDAKMHIWRA